MYLANSKILSREENDVFQKWTGVQVMLLAMKLLFYMVFRICQDTYFTPSKEMFSDSQ